MRCVRTVTSCQNRHWPRRSRLRIHRGDNRVYRRREKFGLERPRPARESRGRVRLRLVRVPLPLGLVPACRSYNIRPRPVRESRSSRRHRGRLDRRIATHHDLVCGREWLAPRIVEGAYGCRLAAPVKPRRRSKLPNNRVRRAGQQAQFRDSM
jgi:hypothetical protein